MPASASTTVAAAAPTTTAAPAASGATSAAAPASSNAAKSLPKVQAYELPMASLIAVAEGSGLQWVNSDPAKIAQVQAAIAAEPKPVHVPRERPPAVVLDEGPLVLVETRKDLSNMNLPF
jgi:ribonuclease E